MQNKSVIAAIDAGGTSFTCALVDRDGSILASWRVPTTQPDETLEACAATFNREAEQHAVDLVAFGIASFGPVDIDPGSPDYGTINGTAKPGWNGAAIGPRLSKLLGLPFYLDTDVNAALMAEMHWGAARPVPSAAYMTVGTGIGVGIFVNGALAGRPLHPELGHIRVARHVDDQTFPGTCVLHGDCLEGLASAKSIEARWGDPEVLPQEHPAWDIEAHYLGQACLNLYLTTRVERIIIGGGLMQAELLLEKTAAAFDELMGDYLAVKGAQLIKAPGLGAHAGVLGGAITALDALS